MTVSEAVADYRAAELRLATTRAALYNAIAASTLSLRELAELTGLSHQRCHQIKKGAR